MRYSYHFATAILAALMGLCPRGASAQRPDNAIDGVTIHTTRGSFCRATGDGTITLNFDHCVPPGEFRFLGEQGFISERGATLVANNLLFVQNTGYYGSGAYLSAQQGSGWQEVIVRLPTGTRGFALDYYSHHRIVVTLSSGESFAFAGGQLPGLRFVGFTSACPLTWVRLATRDGMALDNVSVAAHCAATDE